MRIGEPQISSDGNRHVFSATVSLDSSQVEVPETMWFATHGEQCLFGAPRSDAFLVGQIALAMKLGEDIHVEGPVSSRLAHGMEIYRQILNVWWPECFSPIDIRYEELDSRQEETRPGGVATCFSGGVDSYYSIAELMEPQLNVPDFRVTHALMVNGFDQMDDLEHKGVTRQLLSVYKPALASWGIELVMLDSNLKQFRNPILSISELIHSFNGQLASCGLALAGIFGRFGMSGHASFSYEEMRPGGSHVAVDHFFSTDQLQVIHGGAGPGRSAKLELIAGMPVVQDSLRVCFKDPKFHPRSGFVVNCGFCEKCIRTIAGLMILDQLEPFKTFPARRPDDFYRKPEVLAYIKQIYLVDLIELAERHDRPGWKQSLEDGLEVRRQAIRDKDAGESSGEPDIS